MPASLDKLVTNLRSKARPSTCEECEKSLPNLCSSCVGKDPVEITFRYTYEFVKNTYGVEHLDALLSKQVLKKSEKGIRKKRKKKKRKKVKMTFFCVFRFTRTVT